MADQGQQQEGANIVNIQGSIINEVHGEVIQVDNIQQAQAEVIHAGNIQHLHLHYDNNAAPPPVAQQPQVQADAGSAGNMQEEMPSTSGSASRLQSRERRNIDLGYSNQDLLVAGSASLLQTEEPTNVEINESNIHIMGGGGVITKGEVATTIIRDSVIIIGERSRDGATTAQRRNEFADARLASNDLPCPVYEVTPPPLGDLQPAQRSIHRGSASRLQSRERRSVDLEYSNQDFLVAGDLQPAQRSTHRGSASPLQSRERRNVDLEYSNQDLLVAGSASLLQTEKPTNVEIKESNINIIGGGGMITKGEVATTIIRDSVIIIGERSHDGATTAQRRNEFADARLASNDLPCPVYEVAPSQSGVLQPAQRSTHRGSASRLQSRERRNVDLEYSNQDLLVAGSASLLRTEEPTNIEIKESNINIIGGEGMITKGEGAKTIIRDSVVNIGERSRDGATTAQRKNEFADARLASNDLPCPVYEETPPRLGVLQRVRRATRKRNRARKFINYFNNRTWEQTKVKITENYEEAKLKEPDFEVNPQIRKVPRFYRGEMAPKVTEYILETGFTVRATDKKVGEIISLDVLVEHLSNKEYRYIAILGQAGSGKSTIMKRLARSLLVANKLVEQAQISEGSMVWLFGNTGRRFKFIHHLNIKDILFLPGNRAEEAISPCELLFGKLAFGLATQDVGEGYEWLQENQSMCILFLDGLDQATWNLLGKYNKMKYTDKSSTATIMWNLITGNLFPRMTIVISSREHRIAPLPLELRPQFITALAGFTQDVIKRLFIAVVGDDGGKAWEKLTRQSPALIPLSSVPLFLIFNAIVCKFNPEKLPSTMTEVMLRILHIFMRSDHTHERKRIEEILPNLMGMSFEGTKKKRVIFTTKDLTKFQLQSNEVCDIIIKVPGKNMFNQHLMEGDHLMFFSHQVLQEVLTALYISNMDSTTFRTFIETEFRDDHWAVVRHLLGGIILNPDIESSLVTNFSPDARQDEKKKILREFLASQSRKGMASYQKLELYGTLYEANDTDLIQSCIREIDFRGESFTTAGMHVMSSDIRRCNHLTLVCLADCNLNAELVHILKSNLEGSCLKLDKLDVSENKDLGTAGWAEVGLVVTQCQVKVFKAKYCNQTAEGMKAFKENTGNAKDK
uniref:uncharacterized protein LOC120335076 n=1 Tax=Styela clava TaxID=7725 RepID=UPI00193A3EC1|nr:uncharacterized protein LOC120335076 [Styela clava]